MNQISATADIGLKFRKFSGNRRLPCPVPKGSPGTQSPGKIQIIELPKVVDPRGNLTFLQQPDQLPFTIRRVFWTYDVPGGGRRGGHAYFRQQELIIALSGSFDVVVYFPDGSSEQYSLNRSYYGLYLPAKTWRHMENFSTNALSLHLSDSVYDAGDYIRDLEEWKALKR